MADSDAALFAHFFELGRLLGWHDGSARSKHQEYNNAYRARRRRELDLADDQYLIRHADHLNSALVSATLQGGELAELVLEQQADDKPWVRRPRHIVGLDEPAAIMALLRRNHWDTP